MLSSPLMLSSGSLAKASRTIQPPEVDVRSDDVFGRDNYRNWWVAGGSDLFAMIIRTGV
jgi:hypothetical protein